MSHDLGPQRNPNRLLQEHVKRLLKVEQSLYVSQRSLKQQVRRLDVLARFSADAARMSDPAAVVRRAAEAFSEVFRADQYVCYCGRTGVLRPIAAGDAAGPMVPAEVLASCTPGPRCELLPRAPVICAQEDLEALVPQAGELLGSVAAIFGDRLPVNKALVILVPVFSKEDSSAGALLFRLLGDKSFHEPGPDEEDVPFLRLLSQQLSAALENAALVASLSESYRKLAEAQQELVKRERLAALGELTALVAHEVRNPLAAMVNAIVSLKTRRPQTDDQELLLEILSEEASRLDHIVSDMLDFARPNAPSLRQESVAELVREAALAALNSVHRDSHRLTFLAQNENLQALVDARMVRQAVVNLVLNAAQAVPLGGTITVSLMEERQGRNEVARIDVADSGAGIAREDLDRIFQPFFTTRASGTGLGLALVKRFVEAHQGEVRVSSDKGRGSTFTLLLPLRRPADCLDGT